MQWLGAKKELTNLQSVIKIKSTRIKDDQEIEEIRFYISSIPEVDLTNRHREREIPDTTANLRSEAARRRRY